MFAECTSFDGTPVIIDTGIVDFPLPRSDTIDDCPGQIILAMHTQASYLCLFAHSLNAMKRGIHSSM